MLGRRAGAGAVVGVAAALAAWCAIAWMRTASPGAGTGVGTGAAGGTGRARADGASLDRVSLQRVTDPASVRQAFEGVRPSGREAAEAAGLSFAEATDAVGRLSSEWMWLRFGQPDIEAYIAWRKRQGDRFQTIEEFRKANVGRTPGELFADVLGGSEESRRHATPEDAFRASWDVNRPEQRGHGGVREMSADPGGIAVSFQYTDASSAFRANFDHEIPESLWGGQDVHGCVGLWTGGRGYKDIAAASGKVLTCVVAVVTRSVEEHRRPMYLQWYHDPQSGRWRLFGMFFTNVGLGPGQTPCMCF